MFLLQITPLVGGDGGDADNPERQTFVEIGTSLSSVVFSLF